MLISLMDGKISIPTGMLGGLRKFSALIIAVTASTSVFAEDIGVVPSGAPRTSNVRTRRRVDPRTAQPRRRTVPRRIRSREQAVDLNALSATPTPTRAAPVPETATSTASFNPHASTPGGVLPNLKFYFDFTLRSWKGGGNESAFSFDSYHQRLMVEFTPTPDLMFGAEILERRYFEADYMLTPRLQVRWGRIMIPFDDMSPHNLYGGRINTSDFRQGNETAFLPDLWADLGMGLKYTLSDSPSFASELHFYIVNGFQSGRGTSPVSGEDSAGSNAAYPSFSGTSAGTGDNNNQKAMGARWHGVFGGRFGLGASVYKDTYTSTAEHTPTQDPRGLLMLGFDAQLRPTNTTEIRVGYVTMKVDLDPVASTKASYTRGGTYIELGQRFGDENRWKFLVRAGSSQNDNRVVDVSDKSIVGTSLLKNFGVVEAQVNYFKDLKQIPSKVAYDYGEFRLVTAF
jgi:hypothetical protein